MKNIILKNVSKSYGNELVLDNVSLSVPSGKFFALLGPSGCGKTTILRMIAGFEQPDQGQIFLGDQDITQLPVHKRRVNTVFQNYALFPHLNVFDNVAYSLRIKKVPQDEIKEKVMRMLAMMELEGQWARSINQMSGGQQQRVAIARAIINEPDVLLLDEPLAALDLRLREKVLLDLIDLQEKLGMTFIYVTHDQTEALTVADQMAIMSKERGVEQVGTPKEIYEFPKTTAVAGFVGTTNILQGVLHVQDSSYYMSLEGVGNIQVPCAQSDDCDMPGQKIFLNVRPEKIEISKKELVGFSNHVVGMVDSIVYHGRSTQYNVKLANGFKIQVFEQNDEHFEKDIIDYDQIVHLYWQKENSTVLKQ